MDVHELTAFEIAEKIRKGELPALEVTEAFLQRIRRFEPKVDAFLLVDEENALKQARAVDETIARGGEAGPLAGVPVALKDNMCTLGVTTTCASRILERFQPPYDAHVVEKLRRAGAVILGKTNMDEFAMGSSTENSAFKPTRNPWAPDRVPGGSSGGSAAAVAARMCPLALGSDTGGSIRQPAALCGVVGMKPTYGRVSRYGLVAFASSLDQIGPLATDVRDAAMLAKVICNHDRRDSTSVDRPAPDYLASLEDELTGLTIGVPREYFGEGLDAGVEQRVREALNQYRSMGAETVEISLPHTDYAVATYYIVAPAEASSNLARYDGVHYGHRSPAGADIVGMMSRTRAEGFGPEVQRRILLGTYALSSGYYDAYYLKAAKVRRLIKQDFDRAFEKVDCIMCPTTPTTAFRLGERLEDPLAMYLADVFTISVNLAGIAGISIPCGFSETGDRASGKDRFLPASASPADGAHPHEKPARGRLPVGLQIICPEFEEERMLRIAWAYQQATDHHRRIPPLDN